MILSDHMIQAESLSEFFKNLGKKELNVSKKMAKNVLNKPTRAFDFTEKFATSAVSRTPTMYDQLYLK